MLREKGFFFIVHLTWVTWWNSHDFAERQAWVTDYPALLKQRCEPTAAKDITIKQFFCLWFQINNFCIKQWSQQIFPTHQRLSWAPPGAEWRGRPSAAPSTSWPPRSVDSLRCSGHWWPLCGPRHTRSSGGLWCCPPLFSAKKQTVKHGENVREDLRYRALTLMKAYPAPLSVMVSPRASSVFVTSTSFVSPLTWAKMKSSRPICPPSSFCMSTLWELSVQNRI